MYQYDELTASIDDAVDAGEFVSWAHPLRGTRIFIDPGQLQTLSIGALSGFKAHPPSEIGGLLWGKFGSSAAGERSPTIMKAEPVRLESRLYNTTAADTLQLARTLRSGRTEDGLSLIGYFRSHVREGLCLSLQDQRVIERYLRDADSVFLLIKPFEIGICTAAFFFWQNGLLQTDGSDLEVPFVAFPERKSERNSGGQRAPNGNVHVSSAPGANSEPRYASGEGVTKPPDPVLLYANPAPPGPATPYAAREPAASRPAIIRYSPNPAGRKPRPMILPVIAIVILLAIASGTALYFGLPMRFRKHSTSSADIPTTAIGLRVVRTPDGQIDLLWNQGAAELRNARRGVLLINDGSLQKELSLDGAQLRSGTLAYFPSGATLQFRLEVFLDQGRSIAESLYVVLPPTGGNHALPVLAENAAAEHPAQPYRSSQLAGTRYADTSGAEKHPVPFRSVVVLLGAHASVSNDPGEPPPPNLALGSQQNPAMVPLGAAGVPSLKVPPPFADRGEAPHQRAIAQNAPVNLAKSTTGTLPAATQFSAKAERNGPSTYVPPRPVHKIVPDTREVGPIYDLSQVEVEVNIDPAGRVKNARVMRSKRATSSMLAASLVAARQWIFEPAMLHGKAVANNYSIIFDFHPEPR